MAPRPAVLELTVNERLEKMASSKVEILVGPEKKIYSVPKDVLCYYSKHFDRCFNGSFLEAVEQRLKLEEDSVEDFEFLLGYILTGSIVVHLDDPQAYVDAMEKCMAFIEYADKYEVADVGVAVYDALTMLLHHCPTAIFSPEDVERVYANFPKGHRLRALIARRVLKTVFKGRGIFGDQIQNVDGFAAEIVLQAQDLGEVSYSWKV